MNEINKVNVSFWVVVWTIPRFIRLSEEELCLGFPLYSARVDSLQRCYTIPLEASGSASRVLNGCFCQWDGPRIGTSDLFRRPAWDDPLFRSLVNVTLSPTPSRTMPPHVSGCGRATHSSLVPRTLPWPSPWLSLQGDRVVLISIAWYVRVGYTGGESAVRKCQGEGNFREPKLALRDSPLGGEKTPVRGLRPILRAKKVFVSFFISTRESKVFLFSPSFFFRNVHEVDRHVTCNLETFALHAYFILWQSGRRSLASWCVSISLNGTRGKLCAFN